MSGEGVFCDVAPLIGRNGSGYRDKSRVKMRAQCNSVRVPILREQTEMEKSMLFVSLKEVDTHISTSCSSCKVSVRPEADRIVTVGVVVRGDEGCTSIQGPICEPSVVTIIPLLILIYPSSAFIWTF